MGIRRSTVEGLVSAAPIELDVVVCTYNNAPSLDLTLAALRAQRVAGGVDWRIVVVDNNCTDDTHAVIERHARGMPVHLAMVREPEQGLIPARLRGVRSTTGAWIAFVDDDCLLADDWIHQAAEFARAHPDCGGFGGQVTLDWEQPPPDFVTRYGWAFAEQELGPEAKRVDALAGAGFVVRREALAKTGWLDRQFLPDRIGEKLISGGDVELALRLASGYELWYAPGLRLRHRVPARRTTLRYLRDVTYGLGTAKLLGESMLWTGSYRRWLLTSILGSREWAVALARYTAWFLRRRGGGRDAVIQASFLRGWFAGIWLLFRMNPEERRALLGLAASPRR
jgi:glycosyltransferase involved in cell wall biosynthesis